MKMRSLIGDPGVAEEIQLDFVAAGELVKEMMQIPSDAGERLVERTDVDSDADGLLPGARANRPPHAVEAGMAQSVNDGPQSWQNHGARDSSPT